MVCSFPVTCKLKNGRGRAIIIIIPLFFIIPIKYHYCHGNTTICFSPNSDTKSDCEHDYEKAELENNDIKIVTSFAGAARFKQ